MSSNTIDLRLLIIADDPLARAGLAMLLTNQPGYAVVGQIAGDRDSLAILEVYQPDVILWDLGWDPTLVPILTEEDSKQIWQGTSLERLDNLREAELPIVVLLPDETHAPEVWGAGVRGLLLRNTSPEKILVTVSAAAQGLITIDPVLIEALLPVRYPTDLPPVEALTPRELEVLQLLAEGLPNKTIAHQLNISEHTVKFHVNAIMGKLGAQSRTEAVVRATRLGLILL